MEKDNKNKKSFVYRFYWL